MGILLAVFCCLAWGMADYLGGRASRGRPALLVVLPMQGFGLLTAAIPATVLSVSISASSVIAASAAGVCSAVAFVAFYRALTLGPMGVIAPVVGTSVVIPVSFGALQGHWPPPVGAVGIVVAAGGALLALGVVRTPDSQTRLTTKAKLLCLIAIIGFGGNITLFASAAGDAWIGSTLIMRALSLATLVTIAALRWCQTKPTVVDDLRGLPWRKVGASGVFDVLGNFAFALALTRAPLVPVALLSGMYPVATAALAWVVIGERIAPRQRWGAGAAVVGAALMAAS